MKPGEDAAARFWGAGGRNYDQISFMVSDALGHAVQRLQPAPGEAILDVATGTGWTARNLARCGARVTAIDLSDELLQAARELSAQMQPAITFRQANAQQLPFETGQFDAVISTFGVMFAPDQRVAAQELARVCRKGGRLGLLTWDPAGSVTRFFEMTSKYSDDPPAAPSPMLWGDPEHVGSLLGDTFELSFEKGINRSYHPDGEQVAQLYETSFGPVRQLMKALDETQQRALRRDLVEFHEAYRTDAGLTVERGYLSITGIRR